MSHSLSSLLNSRFFFFKTLLIATLVSALYSFLYMPSPENAWTKLYSDANVQVKYRYSNCDDAKNGTYKELVFLQFENKTQSKIKIYFEKEMWYNHKCLNCNTTSPENNFSVELNHNETISGNCENAGNKNMIIFSKMNNIKGGSKLTKFDIKNVRTAFN